MGDINCPYCGADQDIVHDDGYGYSEDDLHEQHCAECERKFRFTTHISFSYSVYCDGDHELVDTPGHPDLVTCGRGSCEHFARKQ